jgi:large subunit ribosomal protein L25
MAYGDIRRAYKTAGQNTIIDLDVDGSKKKVLIHHVDYHPVSDDITHVEFINIKMDQAIHTRVKVKLEGTAPAVKELQGTLVQSIHEIEIKCLPGDLIHELVLNVEALVDFNASLHVSDIKLPERITLITDPELTVATVAQQKAEEEAPAEPVDLSKIEVTTEKKVDDSAEGANSDAKKEKKD